MALDKNSVHVRLSKAVGQIQAVDRMIASDDDPERILVQINAAKAALHKIALMVEEEAISSVIKDEDREKAITILERFSSLS